ncbi:MAG: hypothetical protein R2695_12690 [Acidimicrobiales bacterium]
MDPPKHTEQRKTVRTSAPSNLRNLEPLIRERTIVRYSTHCPRARRSTGVGRPSIELTTPLSATLFDFP